MSNIRAIAARALLPLAALASSTSASSAVAASNAFAGSTPRDRLKRTRESSSGISPPSHEASVSRHLSSEYPYLVALTASDRYVCSGALVTKFAVLTSARCEEAFDAVEVGGGERFTTYDTLMHPGFDGETLESDFLLILLPSAVANEEVLPVELNRYDAIPHALTLLPSETPLGYIANDDCAATSGFYPSAPDHGVLVHKSYAGKIFDSTLCALEEEAGECTLDLGAPLVVKGSVGSEHLPHDVLFGTASWGGCNARGFPGVYSRTSAAVAWINEAVCRSDVMTSGEGGVVPASFPCSALNAATAGGGTLTLSEFEQRLRRPNIATFTTSDYAEEESRLYKQLREPEASRQSNAEWRQGPSAWRQQPDGDWPHSLILVLYFDGRPEEVSWKFENRRNGQQLAGAAFGDYDASHADKTTVIPLDILTGEDYEDDWTREYRFVIWDMNGNGLCCEHGNGKYELYSKETLVASGASYGAIDEQFFSIDPRTYLDDTPNGGIVVAPTVPTLVVTAPVPAVNVPAPTDPPTPQPTPPPVPPEMPSLMQSFFCGGSFDDAEENCHRPCPTGSPAQCRDVAGQDFICYASTTCRERYSTPVPTVKPTPPPSPGPTKTPTPPPTAQPTEPQPTPPPTPSPTDVAPTPGPILIPNIDQQTWFCGVDWEWFEDNCDKAVPCPRGDAVDCPPNMACFDSTPCTLAPTSTPSSIPSSMPTEMPTPSPTRAPFRIQDLLVPDFSPLAPVGGNGPVGAQEPSAGGISGSLASDISEALESYSSLQFHFFCGKSWTQADNSCRVHCPSGDKNDCPEGQECYANTRCDGRDTPPPSASPAPIEQGIASVNEEACSICEGRAIVPDKAVMFKGQPSTCDNVQRTVVSENIIAESGTCASVRQTYSDSCCQDECQLCQSTDGNDNLLDLRSEHEVKQGEISATCGEINQVLKNTAASDATCSDAQTQLASQCCYQQCTLCGDPSQGMSTEWYATVSFQGLATTCLGIDYLLRAEQLHSGSELCNQVSDMFRERCCFPTSACQLCRADDKLYEVDDDRIVTIAQSSRSTTTTCAAVNDSLAKIVKTDEACTAAKQAFFGQCCELSNVINSGSPLLDGGSGGSGGGGGEGGGDGGGGPADNPFPSPGTPSGGSRPNAPPTPINGAPSSAEPTSSSSPSSKGQPNLQGPQPGPGNSPWEENWNPPSSDSRARLSLSRELVLLLGVSLLVLV